MAAKQSRNNVHISKIQPWDPIKSPTYLCTQIYFFLLYISLGQVSSLHHLINNQRLLFLVR